LSDQDTDNEKGAKWTSLEHRGVTFFPGYVPHGIKILFKVSPYLYSLKLLGYTP
jgi:hypothetical protein